MIQVKSRLFLSVIIGLMFGASNLCFGEEQENIELSGAASIQSGQLMNYKYRTKGHELSHQWMQDNKLVLGLRTQFNPRLKAAVGVMGWLYYNLFPDSMLVDDARVSKATAVEFHFDRAEMIVNASPDPQDSLCEVHIGITPYKYNREARNLGEYMFRTGCYPGYIASDGLDLWPQIAGIFAGNTLFDHWHNALFFTTELYLYPMNDFSLTYLTDATLANNVLTVGGGIQLFRCLPVNNDYTQPRYYLSNVAVPGSTPTAPNYYFAKDDPQHLDTLFYTFAGTKLMARFTFDPKPLLGLDIFGGEDLKLYSEAVILGVKNYRPNPDLAATPWNNVPINEFGYDKLMEKMPVMVGLNLPAFKILDLISVEAEYYGKRYVNRVPVVTQGLGLMRLPVPYDNQLNAGYPNGSPDNNGDGTYSKSTYYGGAAHWKWSLYLKKTLLGNMSIVTQLARDHSRVQTSLPQSIDQEEALIKDKQWYWVLKFGYSF